MLQSFAYKSSIVSFISSRAVSVSSRALFVVEMQCSNRNCFHKRSSFLKMHKNAYCKLSFGGFIWRATGSFLKCMYVYLSRSCPANGCSERLYQLWYHSKTPTIINSMCCVWIKHSSHREALRILRTGTTLSDLLDHTVRLLTFAYT